MGTIRVRGLTLGEGAAKIAAPITGAAREEILHQASALRESPAEIAEWRADFARGAAEPEALLDTLRLLRSALGELPLLFTFRSAREGGAQALDEQALRSIRRTAARSGCVDLIDVELGEGGEAVRAEITALRRHAVVIGSYHDLRGTPEREALFEKLCLARALGADIAKLAVTPRNRSDVLSLLEASVRMREAFPEQLLITISMGRLGLPSRVACALTGSCITFGSVGTISAPGQLPAQTLRYILDALGSDREKS